MISQKANFNYRIKMPHIEKIILVFAQTEK